MVVNQIFQSTWDGSCGGIGWFWFVRQRLSCGIVKVLNVSFVYRLNIRLGQILQMLI